MAEDASSWSPDIFPKQGKLINVCRSGAKRYVLASGPRLSGKTLGCLHVMVDHAWTTDPANCVVISVTQSAGFDSGVWTDLIDTIVPEWIDADFGMEWVKTPATQNITKKPYFIVNNFEGNPVKFQLESLKNEKEVEPRFKSKRYSAMFVNELSNFKNPKTLLTWSECLRMIGLPDNRHLFLCDTNPADEGTKSWIYKYWFELPNIDLDDEDGSLKLPQDQLQVMKMLQPLLGLVEFEIDDNTKVSADRVERLKAMLASSRDLYNRYVKGLWVTASTDALFVEVFRESVHVIGEVSTRSNPNPFIMVPEEDSFELLTGWDLGVTNSAAVIIEKVIRGNKVIFKVLDELVIVGEDFSMDDFVTEFVAKMRFWMDFMGGKVRWKHWSDRSAFDMKEPVSNRYHHQIVWDASPEDLRIQLLAAARGQYSVRQRVDLMRKLLWEERIFFGAEMAPQSIDMLKSIKRGKTEMTPIRKGDPNKHVFDAIMYCVASEAYDEISMSVMKELRRGRKMRPNAVVAVPV